MMTTHEKLAAALAEIDAMVKDGTYSSRKSGDGDRLACLTRARALLAEADDEMRATSHPVWHLEEDLPVHTRVQAATFEEARDLHGIAVRRFLELSSGPESPVRVGQRYDDGPSLASVDGVDLTDKELQALESGESVAYATTHGDCSCARPHTHV